MGGRGMTSNDYLILGEDFKIHRPGHCTGRGTKIPLIRAKGRVRSSASEYCRRCKPEDLIS